MSTQTETQKAQSNFPFTYHTVSLLLIHTIAEIKIACALANAKNGNLTQDRALRIQTACKEIIEGKHDTKFTTCALQGGAGTSLHMNVNEVIADIADSIHPLDHVNVAQSTNDVNPSALRILSYRLLEKLEKELDQTMSSLQKLGKEWSTVPKLGRTHLQDAVPTTMGRSFQAYASILLHHGKSLQKQKEPLLQLPLGGTAIGNGINASSLYKETVYKELQTITKLSVCPLEDAMSGIQSQTIFLDVEQCVLSLYVDLSKIANDIRLLSSGPHGGLGELSLPSLQKGSTIMPGKSNPIICEVVNQTYFLLSGYHLTIQKSAEAAQLELGVMFPILADTLITSLILAQEVLTQFRTKCLEILRVNKERCLYHLEHSHAYATLLSPILGYEQVQLLIQEANNKQTTFIAILKEHNLYSADVKLLLNQASREPS